MKFKSYFRKKAISLKRNFYTVPFIFIVIALVFYSCTLYVHSDVAGRVPISATPNYPGDVGFMYGLKLMNGLFIFLTMLCAILGAVAYLKYMGKIKNYFMLGIYYIMTVAQIVFEILFYIGVNDRLVYERTLDKTEESVVKYIAMEQNSLFLIIFHIVLLVLCLIIVTVAPFIQKKLKNIKFSKISE